MLYPQNGDRIVKTDVVTSLHPTYTTYPLLEMFAILQMSHSQLSPSFCLVRLPLAAVAAAWSWLRMLPAFVSRARNDARQQHRRDCMQPYVGVLLFFFTRILLDRERINTSLQRKQQLTQEAQLSPRDRAVRRIS